MLLVDTGPVVAMADRRDRLHEAASGLLRKEPGPLVMPAQVTAEVDHLLGRRIGEHAAEAFIADLAAGRFNVESLTLEEYGRAADLRRRYRDLALGLADLCLLTLAGRFGCTRIATFDERHFRAVRPPQGGAFTILPSDL